MKTKAILCIISIASIIFALTNCSKTTLTPLTVDTVFFDSAAALLADTGLHLYQKDSSYLQPSPSSGHNFKYFRILYNSIAFAALTDSGRLPQGGSFPVNSLVLMEFWDSLKVEDNIAYPPGPILEYAIIEKQPGNSLAGDGWLWGEYQADGGVIVSIADKGVSSVVTTGNKTTNCLSCHSQVSNYDYNWIFTTHP